MNKQIKILVLIFIFLALIFPVKGALANEENAVKNKKYKLDWDSADWAEAYEVQIKNSSDKLVLNEKVNSSKIEFSLPPGKYMMRIGGINKFQKYGSWSDWQNIDIQDRKDPGVGGYNLNYGLRIGVGMPYFQLLPDWNDIYDNAYLGVTANIGYRLGQIPPFQSTEFLQYLGIDLDVSYIKFEGKNITGRVRSDKTDITIGGNIFVTTRFDFPVNLVFRIGSGLVLTTLEYDSGADNLQSQDPYFKTGLSIEYNFFNYFFLELGADYLMVFYIGDQLSTMKYFCQVGVKF